MTTGLDRVWERIKERAARYGDSCILVSMADARVVVRALCSDELVSRGEPPPDAIEYLASELVRLSLEAGEIARPRLRFHRGSA